MDSDDDSASDLSASQLPPPQAWRCEEAMTSAVERLFAITELLERILYFVPTHHEGLSCACSDFARLFPLQRVSRGFMQTIAGSRLLLHLMVLKPMNLPSEILLKTTLGRLQWFYNEFLATPVDIKGPTEGPHGWAREHHSIRLHKIWIYLDKDSGKSGSLHPTFDLLQGKNDVNASWRLINVALGTGNVAIRIRLRIALMSPNSPYYNYPLLRYSVYWWVNKTDNLGVLFDRYFDVLNRSLEEHTAACETYKFTREYRRYQKRVEADESPLVM